MTEGVSGIDSSICLRRRKAYLNMFWDFL